MSAAVERAERRLEAVGRQTARVEARIRDARDRWDALAALAQDAPDEPVRGAPLPVPDLPPGAGELERAHRAVKAAARARDAAEDELEAWEDGIRAMEAARDGGT